LLIVIILAILGVGYATGGTMTQTAQSTASTGDPTNTTGVVISNSDQSLTGSYITQDSSTWPGASPQYPDAACWNICAAVAFAEGYNLGPGAAPYDLNNPGDLSPGDEAGQATSGPAQVHDGSSIIAFATAEGGWIALYTKFENIRQGRSKVYPASWTWAQVAAEYAGNSMAWLSNVTSYLGIDPNTTPAAYNG
jgi:hypothetical protein